VAAPPPPAYAPPPQIIVVPPGQSYGQGYGQPFESSYVQPSAVATFAGMRLLFGIIPAVAAIAIGGVVAFSNARGGGGRTGGILGSSWNGSSSLLCAGNDSVDVHDVTSNLGSGSVVTAAGNCHFKCTRCKLTAPITIVAAGDATVEIVDSTVQGTGNAVVAAGNASVHITGASTVVGGVSKTGNADVVVPQTAATPPRSNPSPAAPAPVPSKRH